MGGKSATGATIIGWAAAWLVGLALQMQQAALWPATRYAALAAGAAVLAPMVWRLRGRRWCLGALLIGLGFAFTGLRAEWKLAHELPAELQGQDIVVDGLVVSMPRIDERGARFVFDVDAASMGGVAVPLPERLSLGWYRAWGDEGTGAAAFSALRAGQRWRFSVRLKAAHGLLNPHGFDYELWLFEQDIRATGSVRDAPAPRLLAERAGAPIERLRQALRDRLMRSVDDPRIAGVLAALAIGDQAAIERTDWDLFRVTGVAHLMSISGLHVTMFAWVAGLAVGSLWRRSPRAMLALPAAGAARWGGLLVALGYALMAGWGVPAQRTVWMLVTLALLRTLGVQWTGLAMLALTGVVVCTIDPWAMLQPGFWLSFVAVAMLMGTSPAALPPPGARGRSWLRRAAGAVGLALRTQGIATIGLAPLSMVFFQQVSLVGMAANLLAVPLVTVVVTPLAIVSLLVPPLAHLAGAALQGLIVALQALAHWPLALWTAAAPPPWALAVGLVGAACLLLPLPWRWRVLGLLLLPPVLWPWVARPQAGRFELLAADVGQGSAVLVRTQSHLLLMDTGPQYTSESEAGTRVLLPLLRARGESKVDLLVLTHRDTDHVGGAGAVLAGVPVVAMLSSIEPEHALRAQALAAGVPHQRCERGQAWQWDGVRFAVLHPTAHDYAMPHTSNAISCVIQVTDAAGRKALITGDIERPQEDALVALDGEALRSEVLLVPHHGSRTSSSPDFVRQVAPRWAVVQAGYLNRFGHPVPDVVRRFERAGAEVVRSDRCGAWFWSSEGTECTREVRRRYWHAPKSANAAPADAIGQAVFGGAEVAKLEQAGGTQ